MLSFLWLIVLILTAPVNPYIVGRGISSSGCLKRVKSCLGALTTERNEENGDPTGERFNVVLTHCTADFDSLASACGLAKLWSTPRGQGVGDYDDDDNTVSEEHYSTPVEFKPTYVVLPRGAHPGVSKFLSLHKHLFPIRALRNLPDLEGLDRLGLVDAQRLERIGPASTLVSKANHITVVDHHVDGETDIENVKDYVVDKVGSVTTLIVEKLRAAKMEMTAPEATLLALGIHADTGSLCFDSTTPRDASALAWAMRAGASQSAIAEHAHATLSGEQQLVLTQALSQINTTIVAGTSVSTVLLRAEGFVNGLAAVTKDVLDLSSSDVLIMSVVYDTKGKTVGKKRGKANKNQQERESSLKNVAAQEFVDVKPTGEGWNNWKMGRKAERLRDLKVSFNTRDVDGSGYLELNELSGALKSGGVLASNALVGGIMKDMDLNSDGKVSFEEFVEFAERVEKMNEEENSKATMVSMCSGRAK